MNKSILITFAIIAGLFFSSCKKSSSVNNQKEEKKEIKIKNEEPIVSDYAKQSVDDELADRVKNYITTKFLTEGDLRAISEDQRKFQLYKIDLNNDGKEEIFVNFITSYFCGSGGCTVLLLDNHLELVTRFSPTQTLYVDKTVENGWKVLLTYTEGKLRKLVYENGTYPSNPTMVEAINERPIEEAIKIFEEDFSKQKTYRF
ncbi:MAG: hypothetical protein ACOH2V_01705 [Candidatus Saccharimonadaceae bacterium]